MPTASATTHSRSNGDFPVRAEFPRMGGVGLGQSVIARLRVITKYDRAANAQSLPLASTFDVLTL